jgi:uncharacterized protein with PIN domain
MAVKVVDASALGALLFDEPAAGAVADRLEDGNLVAPALLSFEIASVCLKKLRSNPQHREALLAAFALYARMPIEISRSTMQIRFGWRDVRSTAMMRLICGWHEAHRRTQTLDCCKPQGGAARMLAKGVTALGDRATLSPIFGRLRRSGLHLHHRASIAIIINY